MDLNLKSASPQLYLCHMLSKNMAAHHSRQVQLAGHESSQIAEISLGMQLQQIALLQLKFLSFQLPEPPLTHCFS